MPYNFLARYDSTIYIKLRVETSSFTLATLSFGYFNNYPLRIQFSCNLCGSDFDICRSNFKIQQKAHDTVHRLPKQNRNLGIMKETLVLESHEERTKACYYFQPFALSSYRKQTLNDLRFLLYPQMQKMYNYESHVNFKMLWTLVKSFYHLQSSVASFYHDKRISPN